MRAAAIAVGIVFLLVSLTCAWFAGEWTGGYRERHQRYLNERDLLAPVLANDPAFADIKILEATGPGGGIYLIGSVKVGAPFERLKAELMKLFGEPRAKELLNGPYFVAALEDRVPKAK